MAIRKIQKSENGITIDGQLISTFDTFDDGNNFYYIFLLNGKKILYSPRGGFLSYKILDGIDIYVGSGGFENDKLCVIDNKNHLFRGQNNQKLDILKIAPNVEIVFVDLKGNNVSKDLIKSQKILKTKIYLKPQEKPPEGYEVKRGPKGGLYYESHVEISPTRMLEFKNFPPKLIEYEIPKALYVQLLTSKSSEEQLEYAYDIWAWYKRNKSTMSSEKQQIFKVFYRSINRKIRIKLKKDFIDHIGEPKISAVAKKIKQDLESETPEKLIQESEKFIASIIPKNQQVVFNSIDINDILECVHVIYPKFVSKFIILLKEKNARKFLLKTEELLEDLNGISNDEISRDLQWEVTLLRKHAVSKKNWLLRYSKIVKNKGNIDDVYNFTNNIHFEGAALFDISDESIHKIRKLFTVAMMKLPQKVFNRLTARPIRVNIINSGEFYMACKHSSVFIDKSFFLQQDVSDKFIPTILHEFTHLYEDENRKFLKAERKLFSKRTKNSPLTQSLAWNRQYDSYRDRWRDIYMGRVYYANFEITSTTIGDMMDEDNAYDAYLGDPELFLFAKETLFDGKYEK